MPVVTITNAAAAPSELATCMALNVRKHGSTLLQLPGNARPDMDGLLWLADHSLLKLQALHD